MSKHLKKPFRWTRSQKVTRPLAWGWKPGRGYTKAMRAAKAIRDQLDPLPPEPPPHDAEIIAERGVTGVLPGRMITPAPHVLGPRPTCSWRDCPNPVGYAPHSMRWKKRCAKHEGWY